MYIRVKSKFSDRNSYMEFDSIEQAYHFSRAGSVFLHEPIEAFATLDYVSIHEMVKEIKRRELNILINYC